MSDLAPLMSEDDFQATILFHLIVETVGPTNYCTQIGIGAVSQIFGEPLEEQLLDFIAGQRIP